MPKAYSPERVALRDEALIQKRAANREYLLRLDSENLLFPFLLEAGVSVDFAKPHRHGGWESPACQVRGHFLGHWLSAAALLYRATGDRAVKAKADDIIDALAACQERNGGEWAGSIPEKYLHQIAQGKAVWAPHYTLHKTLMGLLDMYEYAQNETALRIARQWAQWFHRWSMGFTRAQFDDILDFETGGMLEMWARLYGFTGEAMYKDLIERYDRERLFAPLLAGADVLTNMHANTTIPEIMGCAAAYEATGEGRWLEIVKSYWNCAVTERGAYVTGGQTLGEIWTPKMELAARLGGKNQEHCTVYNMMRVAEFLFRMTGEAQYMDYYERNLYSGVLAQGYWQGSFSHGAKSDHPDRGLLTYFLPMRPGAEKGWASETEDFFCCHGTLVQANAAHTGGIYFHDDEALYVCQYIPSVLSAEWAGTKFSLTLARETFSGSRHTSSDSMGKHYVNRQTAQYKHNPHTTAFYLRLKLEDRRAFALKIRLPEWLAGEAKVWLNGERLELEAAMGFLTVERAWLNDVLYVELPRAVRAYPLPDRPELVAFADGPVALAGLIDREIELVCPDGDPAHILADDDEREWANWTNHYKTTGQAENIRFVPLNEIGYEKYTLYFPCRRAN